MAEVVPPLTVHKHFLVELWLGAGHSLQEAVVTASPANRTKAQCKWSKGRAESSTPRHVHSWPPSQWRMLAATQCASL